MPRGTQTQVAPIHHSSSTVLLQAVVQAGHAILQPDKESLHKALQELAKAIKEMTDALKRMHGNTATSHVDVFRSRHKH